MVSWQKVIVVFLLLISAILFRLSRYLIRDLPDSNKNDARVHDALGLIGKVVGSNPGASKATYKQQQMPLTQFILYLFASTRLFWLKIVQSFKKLGPISVFGQLRFGKTLFGKMTGTKKLSQLFPFESFFSPDFGSDGWNGEIRRMVLGSTLAPGAARYDLHWLKLDVLTSRWKNLMTYYFLPLVP